MENRNHNFVDLTGTRFGRWTVIEFAYTNKSGTAMWLCECDCGTRKIVCGKNLRQGLTMSCGCIRKEYLHDKFFVDLTGRTYSNLYVKRLIGKNKNNKYVYECVCVCGNTTNVVASDLVNGHIRSCGCIKSHSEVYISDFLNSYNIQFQRQKRFIGCSDKLPLIFDFYIPSMNLAIEYDGELHYIETTFYNDLEGQQRRDAIKTKYCEENDIILLRIPYWEKDNIESILSDWLFLNTDEGSDVNGEKQCG